MIYNYLFSYNDKHFVLSLEYWIIIIKQKLPDINKISKVM